MQKQKNEHINFQHIKKNKMNPQIACIIVGFTLGVLSTIYIIRGWPRTLQWYYAIQELKRLKKVAKEEEIDRG